MACGTGKSLVGVWAADRLAARRVLVLAPTLDLLRQLSRVWTQHATTPRTLLHVSSDRDRHDDDITRGDELGTARTTDPQRISEHLRSSRDLLVMCTNNSSRALADAMTLAPGVAFDLAVVDEAHRCAGALNSTHKTILNPDAIPATRRLFFTATPAVFSTRTRAKALSRNVRVASMDDRDAFGPVIHSLSFAEAIERDLLCPYQVVVVPIDNDEVYALIEDRRFVTADLEHALLAESLAVQIACARAMGRYGCRRVVAFQASIARSKRFAEHFPVAASLLDDEERPDGELWCHHVDGASMPPGRRFQLLERFKTTEKPAEHRLLSNVRLLAEGVDVPGIDAVAFVDTRRGQAQIIQAVGRAVRKAPGKRVGTIVLPIIVRRDERIDQALARTEHRMVVDVLGALRSHDPTVAKSLDTLRFASESDETPSPTGSFVIDAPVEVGAQFAEAVRVALANALGVAVAPRRLPASSRTEAVIIAPQPEPPPSEEEAFARGLDELRRIARWRLAPCLPSTGSSGFPLSTWWEEAKSRWADGTLNDDAKQTIADTVSWLATDLEQTAQRLEMARLSSYDVPAQTASQFFPAGGHGRGALSVILDTGGDPDHLVEPFTAIHATITHPAMAPARRARFLERALRGLAAGIIAAQAAPEPASYYWTSQRRIAIDAFVYALQITAAGPSIFDRPRPPLYHEIGVEAHAAGMAAAEPLVRVVEHLRIYRSGASEYEIRDRIEAEAALAPNDRLDELGWDIYALIRACGADEVTASAIAMDGTFRQRMAVRRDRYAAAVQALRRDDAARAPRRGASRRRVSPHTGADRRV